VAYDRTRSEISLDSGLLRPPARALAVRSPTVPTRPRLTVILCLVTLLGAVASGCSGEEQQGTPSSTTAQPVDVTLPPLDLSINEQTIAFVSRLVVGTSLIQRPLDPAKQGEQQVVTLGKNVRAESLVWAPDGSTLYFVATPEAEPPSANFEIWSLPADGTEPVQLTDDPGSDGGISVSPDGATIAFFSNRGNAATGDFDLWVMGADGTGARKVVDSDAGVGEIQFTPDGQNLVYVTRTINSSTVWTVPLVGGSPTPLGATTGIADQPDVSPDGTQIAFAGQLDGDPVSRIYLMAIDGTDVRALTSDTAGDRDPTWSPDGTKLAFTRVGLDEDEEPADLLYVLDVASGEAVIVSSVQGADAREPAWSSDGKFIAFTSNQSQDDEIAVVAADGSTGIFASGNPQAADTSPAWKPLPAG